MRSFRARYGGSRCAICDDKIEEDDLVVYIDDELCHAGCAEDEGEEVD